MMKEQLILTDEEKKKIEYCSNFCPIHKAVEQYNFENKHIISCPTEMCEEVSKAYILNQRKRKNK